MAMDPAVAGLLGALVGGGFTFAGSIIGNLHQARRERRDRKLEAYTKSIRCLLRLKMMAAKGGDLRPTLEAEGAPDSPNDYLDTQYWLTVLSAVCAAHHQPDLRKEAFALVHSEGDLTEDGLDETLQIVTAAARDDIGAPRPTFLQHLFDRKPAASSQPTRRSSSTPGPGPPSKP